MRALVIVADSTPARLCHEASKRVADAITAGGGTAIVRDLDAEGFRVAMSPEERAAYHTDQPVLDPLVADHVRDLKAADTLVFAYATVLSTFPAVVKGWLDRVLVQNVGFVFDERHRVRPGLTNIRRIIGISTYEQSRLAVKAEHDNGRRTVVRAVRMSAGWRTSTAWVPLYRASAASDDERQRFLDRAVRRAV